jgi:hypothetical protein
MASPSTTDARLLPIYPSVPAGADLELFRNAKAQLGIDYLIKPVRAVNGSPFRVIALRERPDFLCDYAFIPKPNIDSVRNAMEWALGEREDPRAVTIVGMLKEIFQGEVKEIAVPEN